MNHYIRLTVLLVLMIAPAAHAANCALRNPDRQIYEIFPDATAYRTVVSTVNHQQMTLIKERYGIDLDFADHGKHTLYIVMKDGIPIGFVHARIEVGVRGSVELVWALDLEMRIRDFRVQRSREKYSNTIKSDSFRDILLGRDMRALGELVRPDGEADLDRLGLPAEAQDIANCVITCGLKTLSVTMATFDVPLTQARLMGTIHQIFPGTAKVKRITDPLNGVDQRSLLTNESLTVLRAVDEHGATLGILVRMAGECEFWCGIDADGTIRHAMAVGASDIEYARSVAELPGTDLATARALESGDLRDCAVMALEIASHQGGIRKAQVVTGE